MAGWADVDVVVKGRPGVEIRICGNQRGEGVTRMPVILTAHRATGADNV